MATTFDTIDAALKEIKKGRFVVLVDDEDRENEGDLVMAAEKVNPQVINFMAKHARGLTDGFGCGVFDGSHGIRQLIHTNRLLTG